MTEALSYLESLEYSVGNGQCPECWGVPPSWHGHPCHPNPKSIGHAAKCPLAKAIISAGGRVIFENSLSELPLGLRYRKGSAIYEYRKSDEYKAWKKKVAKKRDDLMFSILTGKLTIKDDVPVWRG